MVSFEIVVKSMPPSLSELKVLPSFCFAFKIPDDVTASSTYILVLFLCRIIKQARRKRGLGAKHLTLSQPGGQIIPTTVIQAPRIFRPCDGSVQVEPTDYKKKPVLSFLFN